MRRTKTDRADVMLVEFEAMLHTATQRVGRTVRNLEQEVGGYSAKVPGSGEPGGGKGGRPTVSIDDVRVPISQPEVLALGFAGPDVAAEARVALRDAALDVVYGLGAGVRGWPISLAHMPTWRLVVLGYARVVSVARAQPFDEEVEPRVVERLHAIDSAVERVFNVCQRWGYRADEPKVPKSRAELLAVDLTDKWCTSHLRVGERRLRSRGELCDWCYRHGPLLVPTWQAPPRELVQLHVDNGKVYAHQFEQHIKREADRQRNLTKGARA